MKKLVLISMMFAVVANCSKKESTTKGTVYFGGQIINPKSSKVYIYKNEELIDSAQLNNQRRFSVKMDEIEEGLYSFHHGNEYQHLYLMPNDSLLIRLNTWDFDESLVFSGKGSERNNFLLNLYLENQEEEKQFYKFYALDEVKFQKKTDSILDRKKLLYDQFSQQVVQQPALFKKYAEASIYYPIYMRKEIYQYRHRKVSKKDNFEHLDPGFFKFRKKIDINDKDLKNYYPHYNYVAAYLYHLAKDNRMSAPTEEKKDEKIYYMHNVIKHIKNQDIKDWFLVRAMWDILLDEGLTDEERNQAKRYFFDHCSDSLSIAKITHLINASSNVTKGNPLPNISLLSFKDSTVNLADVVKDKNTVLYTWPKKTNEIDYLAKRVNYLQKKYPDINFLGINSKLPTSKWKHEIVAKNLPVEKQFKTVEDIDWLAIDFSRAILIDRNGKVQNNLTHLTYGQIEQQIARLKNNN